MSNWKKTLEAVMSGQSDANIRFSDACTMLQRLGYAPRETGGSHRIFVKAGCEKINLQNNAGKLARYQVKQMREQIKK
jgi:hypothetical protein